ncbi:MAG: DUF6265 family protein [Pseudomonadota bacterium]
MNRNRAIANAVGLMFGVATFALSGCTATSATDTSVDHPFAWLAGCWRSAAGTEEFWRLTQHGDQLFGYSVTINEGQRVFFEAMRLDTDGDQATFYAYPQGEGPTGFSGGLIGDTAAEFTNPDNDYPQRIRYARVGDALVGTISLIDNSNQNEWRYTRCMQ